MNITLISYLYVFFIALALLADRFPFATIVKSIALLGVSSFKTIRSDTTDDSEKEKRLLANSWGIFLQSIKIIAFIILIASGGLILLLTGSCFRSLTYGDLLSYIITFNGLILSVISFLSYYLLKKLYVKIRL